MVKLGAGSGCGEMTDIILVYKLFQSDLVALEIHWG